MENSIEQIKDSENKKSEKKAIKANPSSRVIGVVQFFDSRANHFGIVITNALGINKKNSTECLYSLRLNERDWKQKLIPVDGDWVTFTVSSYRGNLVAKDGKRLNPDREGLKLALQYRGEFACIKGRDRKGNLHDHNVVCSIIDRILKISSDAKTIIISSFREFLASLKEEDVNTAIVDFALDSELCKRLIRLLPDLEEMASNCEEPSKSNLHKLIKTVESSIFYKKDISLLSCIPLSLCSTENHDKIVQVLENCVSKEQQQVKTWLQSHSDFTKVLLTKVDSLSLDLTYLLAKLNPEGQGFAIFQNSSKSWKELYDWAKQKGDLVLRELFCAYFKDRDCKFVENCDLQANTDVPLPKDLLGFLFEKKEQYSELLKSLARLLAKDDLKGIGKYLSNGIDISHVYHLLASNLNDSVIKRESEVYDFLNTCSKAEVSINDIISQQDSPSDELLVELFIHSGDVEFLDRICDLCTVSKWLNSQSSECNLRFLKRCQSTYSLEKENKNIGEIFQSLEGCWFHLAIKELEPEEQYQILQRCPEDYALNVVSSYFSSTRLYELYLGQRLKNLKLGLPYVAFDLRTEGETLTELAYIKEDKTVCSPGEELLSSFLEDLKDGGIIVGHNVKEWALGKVLTKKGFQTDAFVWDTLEMEILLNPCGGSYALCASKTLEEELGNIDGLFWNQLFRLSQDKDLCQSLSDVIPQKIVSIIQTFQHPVYSEFLGHSSHSEGDFFHKLEDIDIRFAEELKLIEQDGTKEKTLIVAPKRLWTTIAKYLNVSFPQAKQETDFKAVSKKLLTEKPMKDTFVNTLLTRFVSSSPSAIAANLAQHIRQSYLPEPLLSDYLEPVVSPVECVDLSVIDNPAFVGGYRKVLFIGCEIENRLNQFTLPKRLTSSDFWNLNSRIPIRLAASAVIPVSSQERTMPLFHDVPQDASNVWIERTHQGEYQVNYNYDFNAKVKAIKKKHSQECDFSTLRWKTPAREDNPIFIAYTIRSNGFDPTLRRVCATSRYRANYWTYQFALLRRIHLHLPGKPIIYVLDDVSENEKVEQYAKEQGFYVPSEGTLIRKLEIIEHYSDGMLIIGSDQFFELVRLRWDTPFCYVWDHLAVERHIMKWQGFPTQINKSLLQDGINEKGINENVGSTKDTYQSALLSIWPVYEYYFSFIKAISPLSTIFVMDSFFEEYHGLASLWGVSDFGARNLWLDEDSFEEDLTVARRFFDPQTHSYTNDPDVQRAMDVILATLVKSENVPNPQWHEVQKQILPHILKKQENFLISLPTGGGKSVLFQGPALYNSAHSHKLSIVVTPLKALMQDQVKELGDKGFITNVDYINSDRSYQEVRSIYRKIVGGEIALLYVTPERFRSRAFLKALKTRIDFDNGLEYIIFDEAHCICQWGMEFRPEYLNVIKVCKHLVEQYPGKICIAMFSATVTDMIYNQINEIIPVRRMGQENDRRIYNPIRSHIGMEFKEVSHNDTQRLKEIVQYIIAHNVDPARSRMIVFCRTRNQCEQLSLLLAEELSREGVIPHETATMCVGYFHAGMDGEDREDVYNRFKDSSDPLYILCATKAFGMGMDIPNIHYIIHFSPPNVLEDYLQEVGRAGRNEQMYRAVGFSTDNPIPTMCLYSREDIKKAKEQLLQSSLSWKNLEEIRTAIIQYLSAIRTISEAKHTPVVVPNNLWANGQFDQNFTDFKVGMYWLERMGRIKMGFLSQAHINISLHNDNPSVSTAFPNIAQRQYASEIMDQIRRVGTNSSNSNSSNTRTVQISVQELSSTVHMHSTRVIDILLLCQKRRLLSIEQTTRCRVAFTRLSEVYYLLQHSSAFAPGALYSSTLSNGNRRLTASEDCRLALHIILDAAKHLLENMELGVERSYSLTDIKHLIQDDVSTLNGLVKTVLKRREDGRVRYEKYMVWYNENDLNRNNGLSLANSYKNDLYKKRLRQVFFLLEMIPDVKIRSYTDTEQKCVLQSVIVEKTTWRSFLAEFEQDCIKVLNYIYQLNTSSLSWADTIIKLGLEQKGFAYFESILRYLNGMAYISSDPLLPMGIEVFTTETTEEVILENLEDTSRDYECKRSFDQAMEIRNLRLCVMDVLTSKIRSKQNIQELISTYFSKTDVEGFIELLGKYYDEDAPIWDAIRASAIKNAEQQLRDNIEQLAIYNENSNVNVNVEAGPGSGKTHMLTLKCAKLIFHQHVKPQNILVLAYNRAVVVELKNRLAKLFASLGLSRSASQLHVYTFSALSKRICGDSALEGVEMSQWESVMLQMIRRMPNVVRALFPELQYVFIDEFQDITQIRLDAMLGLRSIFPSLTFFTIGDKDQSIYGFEKVESMDPNYYYEQLYEKLGPKKMTMNTNYRSFPKILSAASRFLPQTSKVPRPCRKNMEHEPQNEYVFIYNGERQWHRDFGSYIQYLKHQGINDVAVFFRTNNEVYHGYSLIKVLDIPGIRIRIQGASSCEMYRLREIYAVLKYLDDNANRPLVLQNDETENTLRSIIAGWIENPRMRSWDSFYMDFAFVLILDYIDFARSDEESHTYGDMADSIRETLKEDNPQIYKLYEDRRFEGRRIFGERQMNVVLTTMHKVKGLEFDAVIITPSVTSLPFNPTRDIPEDTPLSEDERQQILEEQRLLYVAYTRARKFLFVYKGERELAVERVQRFGSEEDQWGIRERKPGLENYNIGYNAGYNFQNNKNLAYYVKRNDPVSINRFRGRDRKGEEFFTYNIVHNGVNIGQLSKKSSIAKRMEEEGISLLTGFFVSDVFYWTYQDSLSADQRIERETGRNPRFAEGWCEAAKNQGYIFIVNIAGYGQTTL